MLERLFHLSRHNTTVRTEILAGLTTFLTMAYIIFVQPAVLSGQMFHFDTGMNFYAVAAATCLSAAVTTILMGLLANYPIALAPGMGENFFFVFTVLPAVAAISAARGWTDSAPWQIALGIVFISGLLFLLISVLGIRKAMLEAISPSMKNAIAVGIGLFIAFIGLQNSGLIISAASIVSTPTGPQLSPGTLVKLNTHFQNPDLWVFALGLLVMTVLHVRRVRGSILWGIAVAAALTLILRLLIQSLLASENPSPLLSQLSHSRLMTQFRTPWDVPAEAWNPLYVLGSLKETAGKMDLIHALAPVMIPYIILFLFMDVFDTIGTLIGVAQQAGLIVDNRLPRAGRAMFADAFGTVFGAALGTSTVTSYIESAAGVEQGGRTGLTALVAALGFLLALFFSPIIAIVGSYPPITAPALVLVGAMMIRNVTRIAWDDYSESIPAFLTLVGIPFSYNIADGLALGFIAYPIIKVLSGKARDIGWISAAMALALLAYFIFVRAQLAA